MLAGGERAGMSTTGSTCHHLSPSGTRTASFVQLNVYKPVMFKELLATYLEALLAPSQKYKQFSLRALGGQVRYQKKKM